MASQLEPLDLGEWELTEIPLPDSYEHPPPPHKDSDAVEAELREGMGEIFPEELGFVLFSRHGSVIHDGKNAVMVSQLFKTHRDPIDIAATFIELAEEKKLQGKIRQLYGFMKFSDMSEIFVFQEWLDGYEDVSSLLENGQLSEEDVHIISEAMLDIVSILHELGYVHLDLKLSNFMYNPVTKDLKLIDFESAVNTNKTPNHDIMYVSHAWAPPEYDEMLFSTFNADQMMAFDLYNLGLALLVLQTYDPKYPNGIPNELLRERDSVTSTVYLNILGHVIAHGKKELLPLLHHDPMKRRFP